MKKIIFCLIFVLFITTSSFAEGVHSVHRNFNPPPVWEKMVNEKGQKPLAVFVYGNKLTKTIDLETVSWWDYRYYCFYSNPYEQITKKKLPYRFFRISSSEIGFDPQNFLDINGKKVQVSYWSFDNHYNPQTDTYEGGGNFIVRKNNSDFYSLVKFKDSEDTHFQFYTNSDFNFELVDIGSEIIPFQSGIPFTPMVGHSQILMGTMTIAILVVISLFLVDFLTKLLKEFLEG